jgi:hypothetical protein
MEARTLMTQAATIANYPLASLMEELATIEAEERAAIAAEKEAKEHRKGISDRRDDCRDRIVALMREVGVYQDDSAPLGRVSIVKAPPRLVIDDAAAIPDEFFSTSPVRDDARIKARLVSGAAVPGARIEQAETLKVEWKK